MQRRFLNITGMGATTLAYMNQNQTIWSGTPAVVVTVGQLDTALGGVNLTAQDQQQPIVGVEDAKALVRYDLEEEMMRLAGVLGSLAQKTTNLDLAAQVEFTEPQLDKMDADTLEETANRIAGLAAASLTGLADYNIKQADLTAFGTMITDFHNAKTGPRTAIAKRKGKTTLLPPGVRAVKSILHNQLDGEMRLFKRQNPDFYAGYLSARVIVDRGNPAKTKKTTTATAPKP